MFVYCKTPVLGGGPCFWWGPCFCGVRVSRLFQFSVLCFWWGSCFSSVLVFCVVFLFCLSSFCTLCIQCCQFLWINCLFFITPSVFSNVYLESLKSYQSVNLITIEDIWKCTFMYNTFMLLNVCPIILRWYYFQQSCIALHTSALDAC